MSLLWLTVCFALAVMQPAFVQPPVLNARVAGRLIDRVSGTPVTGAVVMLLPDGQPFPPAAIAPPQALTDGSGNFLMERVWAGRFRIQIRKTGFAPVGDRPDAQTLDVRSGQSIDGLVLEVARGAVLAGRMRPFWRGITPSANRSSSDGWSRSGSDLISAAAGWT